MISGSGSIHNFNNLKEGGIDDNLSRYIYKEEVKEYILDSCIDSFGLYTYAKKIDQIMGNNIEIFLNPLYDCGRIEGIIICVPVENSIDKYHFMQIKDWYDIHSGDETDIELISTDEYILRLNRFSYDDEDYEEN